MDNYIVRIYRYEKDNPKGLVGVIEEVGVDGKRAFTNLDELWGILNPIKKISASCKHRVAEKSPKRR